MLRIIFIVSTTLLVDQEINKKFVDEYLNDIANVDYSIDDIIAEYHSKEAVENEEVKTTLIGIYNERRAYLKDNEVSIKSVNEKSKLPTNLEGLVWKGDLFLISSKKDGYLFPLLVSENNKIELMVMSKGNRKYFLGF